MSPLLLLLLPLATLSCSTDIQLIEKHEGLELCVYTDTTGNPTICYGFNLNKGGASSEVARVGGDYSKLVNKNLPSSERCLSQTQCVELLTPDVQSAESGAKAVFGSYCPCVQAVLTDLVYNLGQAGAAQFTTFKSYLQAHNYKEAANDLKGTLWCRQVGNRCTDDTSIIAQGC